MTPLHRHQLAYLKDAGWRRVLRGPWDAQAQDCLAHWANHRFPLVVTRQRTLSLDTVELGLPAPLQWKRRRIGLNVERESISHFDAFPLASQLVLLGKTQRTQWHRLCEALAACGVKPRIYGSHGWQLLTGLDHLRPGSDIDLCIAVDGPAQADAVAALLQSWPHCKWRLDGELVFDGGSAVAWREWAAWRAQRTAALLVKRLHHVHLAHEPFWRAAELV